MYCGIDDLPVELLLKIISFVTPVNLVGERDGKTDLCHLRLVCQYLNDLVSPVLFERLNLQFIDATWSPNKDCFRCRDIIVALATGATRAFQYTKALELSASSLFSPNCSKDLDESIKTDVMKNIFAAISSLRNLRKVAWLFDYGREPESFGNDFVRALGTISCFEAFERLCLPEGLGSSISLKPISHLTAMRVVWNGRTDHFISEISSLMGRCPGLTHLSLEAPHLYGDGTSFNELFADVDRMGLSLPLKRCELDGVVLSSTDIASNLRHFTNVEFMGISRNPSPLSETAFGEICATLKEMGIFLKGICTDFLEDPLLLDYLISYSGLEELLLEPRLQSPDPPSDLVERFYTEMLPAHHKTLEQLRFTSWPLPMPTQLGPPSIDPLAEVAKCRSLRTLEVRYPGDGLRKDPGNFEAWLEVCANIQNLTRLNIHSYLEPSVCDKLKQFREKNGKQFLVWGL